MEANQRKLLQRLQTAQNPLGWAYRNLFSSPLNIISTFIGLWIIYAIFYNLISWGVINANWSGTSGEDCIKSGACWVFIKENFLFISFGFYPQEYIWRPSLAGLIGIIMLIPIFLNFIPRKIKLYLAGFLLIVFPIFSYGIIHGSLLGIKLLDPIIPTDRWGGFMLTVVLASVGMVASLPIGIALALGRRADNMPLIKMVCIIFIEFWRGVPLITVLFMASVMLPLFFPEGTDFDKLARALIGITLFQSAYMAEVIRGGLQAIEKGQYEAADALGLTYWKKMGFIILPQALKLVIPGIVNTLIALFKDTSLVYIIGMWDLLHSSYGATRNPEWLKYSIEGLFFAALIFWICCFFMSRYSQSIERKLSVRQYK